MTDAIEYLKSSTNRFRMKYWNDPVWSKVIAAAIIAIGSGALALIWASLNSILGGISFAEAINEIFALLSSSTVVPNYIILLFLLFFLILLANYISTFASAFRLKKAAKDTGNDVKSSELPKISEHSTVFFSYRLGKAFPGQRGLQWYDGKTAVERFRILFREPLKFQPSNMYGVMSDPVWWFRGSSSLNIDSFSTLSKTKILLDVEEIEVKRIAVLLSDRYHRCFVYVEAHGEKPTGANKLSPEDVQRQIHSFGYAREECGLFGKNYISRGEYDDGAALIKGKVVDTHGAQLRVRFLSPYNFIVAAKQSPYNQQSFYRDSEPYFTNILRGSGTPEQLFQYLETLEIDHDW